MARGLLIRFILFSPVPDPTSGQVLVRNPKFVWFSAGGFHRVRVLCRRQASSLDLANYQRLTPFSRSLSFARHDQERTAQPMAKCKSSFASGFEVRGENQPVLSLRL